MSLINTGNNYNVYLNIPNWIDVSFNNIDYNILFDIDTCISNLKINNNKSLIVLWGADYRIPVNDCRMYNLNKFYHTIENPMILFNGCVYADTDKILEIPNKEIIFFQYLSKLNNPNNKIPQTNKNKKFIFTSSKDYLSRRYILNSLFDGNFDSQGTIAYKCLVKDFSNELFFDLDQRKFLSEIGDQIEHLLPIIGFDQIESMDYTKKPKNVIQDTYLSIITETFFEGPIFLSEKVFDAMMYNHFFIYLGPQHSLKYLRSQGFKTWNHIIDESYDDISDPFARLIAFTKSLNTFLSKSIEEMQHLYIENLDIIEHNRRLVRSFEINDDIITAMRDAIQFKNQMYDRV